VCGTSTTPGEVELEFEFTRDLQAKYRAHPRCFAAFRSELEGRSKETDEVGQRNNSR
jgi:hypothetical protein